MKLTRLNYYLALHYAQLLYKVLYITSRDLLAGFVYLNKICQFINELFQLINQYPADGEVLPSHMTSWWSRDITLTLY